MKNNDIIAMCLSMFLLGMVVGILVGNSASKNQMRKQAINAGVAQYDVDPKTGKVSFIFRDLK